MAAILSRPQCVKKWLCYSGHRVALMVHRAQKSVPDSAGEWPTFLPPPLESCSGTANVDGPNWYTMFKTVCTFYQWPIPVQVSTPFYTGAVTFVPPLCHHKTGQVAVEDREETERLPWSFKGGTQDVQTSPWMAWSPWSFEHVQNSRTKVAEEVGRSQVALRRQEEGTHIAMVAEWMYRLWGIKSNFIVLVIHGLLIYLLWRH